MHLSRVLPTTLLALSFIASTVYASDSLTIATKKGKVEGALTVDGKVRTFKGIPYAAPPTGDLRWQPRSPQPSGMAPAPPRPSARIASRQTATPT